MAYSLRSKNNKGRYNKTQANRQSNNATSIKYTEDHIPIRTLYVSALPFQVSKGQIIGHFDKYGKVEIVRIYSQPTHTYAFVTLDTAEAAAKALSQGWHYMGRKKINVLAADSWHQTDKPVSRAAVQSTSHDNTTDSLPIELTNLTGTQLLALNDDCLFEILTFVAKHSILDLSAIAETCSRLQAIAIDVFVSLTKKTPHWYGSLGISPWHHMKQIMSNFGHLIKELALLYSDKGKGKAIRQFELIQLHCSNSLEALTLQNYAINKHMAAKLKAIFANLKQIVMHNCTLCQGAMEFNMFENCQSLVTLKYIVRGYPTDNNCQHLLSSTFTNLESLSLKEELDSFDIEFLLPFLKRHPNLKKLSLKSFGGEYYLVFPVIAGHLKQLEKLYIRGNSYGHRDFIKSLEKLAALENLKKLKLSCERNSINGFLNDLKSTESLEHLKLSRTKADDVFFKNLHRFKNIGILHLVDVAFDKQNISPLSGLKEITELLIKGKLELSHEQLLELVAKLPRLNTFTLVSTGFDLNEDSYRKLVKIICNRTDRLPLEIFSYEDAQDQILAQNEGNSKEFVRIHYHSPYEHNLMLMDSDNDDDDDDDDDSDDSDDAHLFDFGFGYDSDYNFEDSDDDMDGPNGQDFAFLHFLLGNHQF